jgi:hypothetical protein
MAAEHIPVEVACRGPGCVDLGLLRLAGPPTVAAIDPPCLADRADRRGSPALSWHLRRPPAPCRAAAWPRDPGRPQGRCPADAPRRSRRRHWTKPKWRHAIDQVAADLVDRNFARSGPNQLWVTDITEHPTREGMDAVDLHGAHDFRDTFSFSTWLQDAGVPARVIDELMGHEATGRSGQRGSAMGAHYRHTTPEMAARAVDAIQQRLTVVLGVAELAVERHPNRSRLRVF